MPEIEYTLEDIMRILTIGYWEMRGAEVQRATSKRWTVPLSSFDSEHIQQMKNSNNKLLYWRCQRNSLAFRNWSYLGIDNSLVYLSLTNWPFLSHKHSRILPISKNIWQNIDSTLIESNGMEWYKAQQDACLTIRHIYGTWEEPWFYILLLPWKQTLLKKFSPYCGGQNNLTWQHQGK